MSGFKRTCLLGLVVGLATAGAAWAQETVPEDATLPQAATATPDSPAADVDRMPEGDPARGRLIFGQCRACHYPEPAMGHNNGPNLHRIFGKVAGKQEGFEYYSETFREAQFVWTPELLWLWLADPLAMFPDTTMMSLGIPDPQERADLVAYLMRASVRGVDESGAEMSSPYSRTETENEIETEVEAGIETETEEEIAPWPP